MLLDLPDLVAVDPGDGPDLGLVPPVHLLQRIGDLADGGLGPGGVDRQRQQVVAQAVLAGRTVSARGPGQFGQRGRTAASSRSARSCCSLAICSARTRLFSTLCTSISWSSSTWYLLMPITAC